MYRRLFGRMAHEKKMAFKFEITMVLNYWVYTRPFFVREVRCP